MLTVDELARYETDGLTIPSARLSEDYVQRLRRKAESFIAAHPHLDPDYIPSIVEHDPEWLDFAREPIILDSVAQVIGPDIVLWGSALFCKSAEGGKATPWHQDGQYWPIRPLATCTVWIALDDATISNGCLKFLPGSHKDKRLESHHLNNSDDIALPLELDHHHIDESKAEAIELEAGQISLHDVFLMHASEANRSNQPRRGMTLRYMPTSSVYRRDLNKSPQDTKRPVFLIRGIDQSGENDFALR